MNYPLISEYIEAIRSAEDNFDKLTNLRPVLDGNGNPIMSSGNFAVVFKMEDVETGKLYAVKCFTREQEEREERYKAIVKELEYEDSPFIVQTRYFENELFVDTSQCDETEFPIVLMDWIEGVTLDLYMKSIEDSQFRRELLADQFQKLVCWLLPKHFAHGDLKPDNIIVKEDGDIVLVDYDGMFVPALRGKEALEMGTPMFRHSGRTLSFFNEYIDDYAAVLLLVILRVNAISTVDFNKCLTTNSAEFMRLFEPFLNHPKIAPLLSAYIMVSTFGRIDRQQVGCLLANNSDYDYNKELALIDLARKGDTVAMIQLGNLYKNGIYVPQSSSKATQWYTLAHLLGNADAYPLLSVDDCYSYTTWIDAAEKGNLYAQGQLGRCYVEKDWKKAVYWWQKAAKSGNPLAQNNLGVCYKNGKGIEKDFSKAIYWYQKAAETGISMSQYNLGTCYKNGEGVKQNWDKAVFWYQKAAETGNSLAQKSLGACYKNGEGIKKDCNKAVYWYQRAAEAGNSTAQFNLGKCYYKGEGVEKDIIKAVYWYRKAAEAGNSKAQNNLGYCYKNGKGVEKDIIKAVYWYRKAAETGNSFAQFNLGCYYENGEGVEKDISKAVYWYRKAAEAGNSKAQNNFAFCYYKGEGVEKDIIKAVYWFQKAAEAGNSKAQNNLAFCYYKGEGIEKDLDKGVYWFQKAADSGSAVAIRFLACYYFNGENVKQYREKTEYWFRKAMQLQNEENLSLSKKYHFIETLTIEQFKAKQNDTDFKMIVDNNKLFFKCGSEKVFIACNSLNNCIYMISHVTPAEDKNNVHKAIWILHEEGAGVPILLDF